MGQNAKRPKRSDDQAKGRSAPAIISGGNSATLAAGLVLLLVACAASAMLVIEHFGGLKLPGCGPGSGCDQAARSVWGKLPGLGWPVSFVGLAYFAAMFLTWSLARGRLPVLGRVTILVGGAASVLFLIVMATGGYFCQYCAAAHAANLALCALVLAQRAEAAATTASAPLVSAMGVGFAVVLGALLLTDRTVGRALEEAGEAGRARTADEIAKAATKPADLSRPTPVDPGAPAATGPATTESRDRPFTGRWRTGPDPAAIRIVMLTDYQCEDCKRIEAEIAALLSRHASLSLSIKHFPLCTDCNAHAGRTLHPNACWAARAAEAAGILGGSDGFWRMHHWLFDQKGSFTDASLPPALQQLGFDPAEFQRVMQSPETLARVRADVQEGIDLGLYRTPMIFINGIELKDWHVRGNAVTLTVDQVAATNPPPRSADADRPPLALERFVADWREEPLKTIPPAEKLRILGPDNARVSVVVFGDYQEPSTTKANAVLTQLVQQRGDMRLDFRHYPFNQECNPTVPRTQHPLACRAALAAEAAATVGGVNGFWAAHNWLCAHQSTLSDALISALPAELGLDSAAFAAALADPSVSVRIAADCNTGKQIGLREIPTILINGRRVPRWQRPGRPDGEVLERIVVEAAQTP